MWGKPVEIPVVSKKFRVMKSFGELHSTLSKINIQTAPVNQLISLAGSITHSTALHNLTYGKKRASLFAGELLRNIESIWAFYNKRLAEKKPVLVTPKEEKALRKYFSLLAERLQQKALFG
jgi:hypothetical protein